MSERNHKFWGKVDVRGPGECWPWLGYVGPSGHGLTTHQCTSMYASRKAWILTHGPIRDGKSALHLCDNGICCNPDHLYLGTRANNMVDRWSKTPPDKRIPHDRTTVLGPEDLARYFQMRKKGLTVRECAAQLGVHHVTVYRMITSQRRQKLRKLRADRLSSCAQ